MSIERGTLQMAHFISELIISADRSLSQPSAQGAPVKPADEVAWATLANGLEGSLLGFSPGCRKLDLRLNSGCARSQQRARPGRKPTNVWPWPVKSSERPQPPQWIDRQNSA